MKAVTLLLAFFPSILFAQFHAEKDPATGKKGIVNPYNGEIIIPFEYDELNGVLNDSIYVVQNGGKYGVIDQRGKLLIPMNFGQIIFMRYRREHPCVFARVYNEGSGENKWSVINRKGEPVLSQTFTEVNALFPDMLVAKSFRDSMLQFFDGKGKKLFERAGKSAAPGFDENSIEITRRDRSVYFIQKNGEPFFDNRYPGMTWTDGDLIVYGKTAKGMVNIKGDTILPFVNEKIQAFDDGNFLVEGSKGIFALANSEGKLLVPFAKQHIQKWQKKPESAYTIKRGSRWEDLLDRNGKLLVAECRVQIGSTGDYSLSSDEKKWDYLKVGYEEKMQWGLFRSDGTQILPIEYNDVKYFTEKHPILVSVTNREDSKKSKMLAFNFKGENLLPDRFYRLQFTRNPRILIACESETFYWGFLDLDKPGKATFEYDGIYDLGNGYFSAKSGNNFRLFGSNLKELEIENFTNVTQPIRTHFDQFRKQKIPGKLVAIGYRPNAPTPFAINDKGKSFPFDPLPEQRVETVVDLSNATGSGRGKSPEKSVEIAVEAPPPPVIVDKVEEVAEISAPSPPPAKQPTGDEVVLYPQKTAEFPGGEPALRKYLKDNLQYPEIAKGAKIQGAVTLSFVIEKDGSITNIVMNKDIGGGCGKEAERVVSRMPNWYPAMQHGNRVRSVVALSVPFELK